MIDSNKRDRHLLFTCDGCEEFIQTDTSEWYPALDYAAAAGWLSVNNDNAWKRYCPSCAEKLETEKEKANERKN